MASRVNEAQFRPRAGRQSAAHATTATLSIGQRLLFVLSLVTFALASSYTAIALLTRVTPALFPGKTLELGFVSSVLEQLPSAAKVEAPGADSPFNSRINLLIMGVDSRPLSQDSTDYEAPDQPWPTHTDTIIVATIDPLTNKVSLLSFPRDMFIDTYPKSGGHYKSRINNSYSLGVQEGKSFDAGAEQMKTDLKKNFGIDIDHWVWLEFKGVEKLVNAVGGVDVVVPDDLQVPNYGGSWYYSDDDIHARYIQIPPGPNHLSGYNAVAFGRFRDDSDLQRVKRQQLVLEAAISKVFERGLLNNPLDLWDAYSATVHTDIPKGKMPGYALLLKASGGNITGYSMGDPVNGRPTVWGFTTEDGAAVLDWDRDNVQYILAQAFTPAKYSASTVEIQNGTGTADTGEKLARGLGQYLKYTRHLPDVDLGIDVATQTGTSIVLYTENRKPMAQDIAKWLGVPDTAIQQRPKPPTGAPDVVIIIGKDFKLPGS